MHIEMEHKLFDDGSDYNDIYGGKGRLLTDEATILELKDILLEWVK